MIIPRVALFEFEDQWWCPALVRDATAAYLETVHRTFGPYDGVAQLMAPLVAAQPQRRIVDLGAGAGGLWPRLLDRMAALGVNASVTCTDLRPKLRAASPAAADRRIAFLTQSVAADSVPLQLDGVRTMFTALHHLEPAAAQRVFLAARAARTPIAVFEATHRSPKGIAATALIPLMALGLMLVVRPAKPLTLLFTYLIPVVPLAIAWDGFVSTLRTYTAAELRNLTAALTTPDYEFVAGEIAGTGLPITYCIGRPR